MTNTDQEGDLEQPYLRVTKVQMHHLQPDCRKIFRTNLTLEKAEYWVERTNKLVKNGYASIVRAT